MAAVPESPSNPLMAMLGDRMSERAKRVMTLALLAQTGWKAAQTVRAKVAEHTAFRVSVAGNDDLYGDVQQWLLERIPPSRRRALTARFRRSGSSGEVMPDDARRPPAGGLLVAYDGTATQRVAIDGYVVEVGVGTKERGGATISLGERSHGSYEEYMRGLESITFKARSAVGRDAVLGMLRELADARSRMDRPPSFRIGERWGWSTRNDLPRRQLASVVLTAGQKEAIVEDLTRFLAAEADYDRLGIPWHRGYLFHGPPGTGKTSLAKALATHFGLDVYYLPLDSLQEDAQLLQLVNGVGARSMLLLEDIDVATAARERNDANPGITLSGLLNALDGVATPHGLITVMTTNRVEVLDSALTRPGRVDRSEEIGLLDAGGYVELVRHLFGADIAVEPPGDTVPAAAVVEIAKRHLNDPASALTDLGRMKATID